MQLTLKMGELSTPKYKLEKKSDYKIHIVWINMHNAPPPFPKVNAYMEHHWLKISQKVMGLKLLLYSVPWFIL